MKRYFLAYLASVFLINTSLMGMEEVNWQNHYQDDRADDDMLRAAGILNNDPVENPAQAPLPAPRGPFFREPPRPDSSNVFLIGASVGAAAAGLYGLYKLIEYMTSSDLDTRKDIKTALVDLQKEAKKAKEAAQNRTYKKGTLLSYFNAQVEAGSFSALSQKTLQDLCAAVSSFEQSLIKHDAVEDAYFNICCRLSALLQAFHGKTEIADGTIFIVQ